MLKQLKKFFYEPFQCSKNIFDVNKSLSIELLEVLLVMPICRIYEYDHYKLRDVMTSLFPTIEFFRFFSYFAN